MSRGVAQIDEKNETKPRKREKENSFRINKQQQHVKKNTTNHLKFIFLSII